jgi:heme oxygenase (mycobilin-producing)
MTTAPERDLAARPGQAEQESPARVVFLIRVPADKTDGFRAAYEQIRYLVASGVPGHRLDQVCQSAADPEQWLITSEWDSLAAFEAWERDEAHRTLVSPLRACFTEARSLRFVIRAETSRSAVQPGKN